MRLGLESSEVLRQARRVPEIAQAMDALAADEVIKAGIGNDLAEEFIRSKRMEWIEYSRHVSEWESQRYLEMF